MDITFLDFIEDAGPKEEHYPYLKKIEAEWMTNLGTLSTINPRSGLNFRDEAKSQGWAIRWSGRWLFYDMLWLQVIIMLLTVDMVISDVPGDLLTIYLPQKNFTF